MKKSFVIAGIAAMSIIACKKETTETMSDKDSTANALVDSSLVATDSLKDMIDSTATITKDAVKDAATATTEQGMDNAKAAVKGANDATEKAAEKAADASKDAKDAVNKATK